MSRDRLEDAQRELELARTENRRLLDLLLGGMAKPDSRVEATFAPPVATVENSVGNVRNKRPRAVEVTEDDGIRPVTEGLGAAEDTRFTTPFDTVSRKFDHALKTGTVDRARFRAR